MVVVGGAGPLPPTQTPKPSPRYTPIPPNQPRTHPSPSSLFLFPVPSSWRASQWLTTPSWTTLSTSNTWDLARNFRSAVCKLNPTQTTSHNTMFRPHVILALDALHCTHVPLFTISPRAKPSLSRPLGNSVYTTTPCHIHQTTLNERLHSPRSCTGRPVNQCGPKTAPLRAGSCHQNKVKVPRKTGLKRAKVSGSPRTWIWRPKRTWTTNTWGISDISQRAICTPPSGTFWPNPGHSCEALSMRINVSGASFHAAIANLAPVLACTHTGTRQREGTRVPS